jgi:hypothetical protein
MTQINAATPTAARSLFSQMDRTGRNNYDKRRSAGTTDSIVTAATTAASKVLDKLTFPYGSGIALVKGLAAIGKAHSDANRTGEAKAFRRGLAETLGRGLDNPTLNSMELLAQAKKSAHVQHFGGLAKATGRVKIAAKHREKFQRLADKYMKGAEGAMSKLYALSPADRQSLVRQLKATMAGESTASRIYDLLTYGGPR